jgi:hypothetical protein
LRDTPAKLRGANFEREKACALGREDRKKAGLSFDESSIVKVSGIGNAQISAEFGNALVRYWECYLPSAEIR